MTKEDQILEELAKLLLLELLKSNVKFLDEYLNNLNGKPAVQLFGVSQAGKSTLISCLTSGEQWIPIGTGTATTAVKVELLSVDYLEQTRAEIKWLTKEELLDLVKQAPMDVFIQAMEKKPSPSARKFLSVLNNSNEKEKNFTLDSREYRGFLWESLQAARRERENDMGEVGQRDNLAVAEVILRHYEKGYLREFSPEGITIKGKQNLPDISRWTRQPHDWLNREISTYDFDDLRSFFTREVRLYTPTQDAVKGLRILDTPGFGVNLLHNKVCREAQREAKAVILVLGSQLTLRDLEEIKQLKTGMSNSQLAGGKEGENIKSRLGDNIFIIWNQKNGSRKNSETNLKKMLELLHREVNITIPPNRVAIVNLRLALRAMQWKKIQLGEDLSPSTFEALYQIFLDGYPEEFEDEEKSRKEVIEDQILFEMRRDEEGFSRSRDHDPNYLELSGWNSVIELLESISNSQKQIQRIELAANLLETVKNYLQGFSTPKEAKRKKEQTECLESILAGFKKKVGLIRTEMETEIDSRDEVIFRDFLSYLTDDIELKNLRARVKSFIDSELYFTNVPGNIKAKLIDYVDSRCSVWLKNFEDLATSSSREEVLGGYQKSIYDFKTWILREIKDSGGSFEIKLPTAKDPRSNLNHFASLFKKWSDEIIDDTFSINWLDRIGITFAAAASDAGYAMTQFGNQVGFLAESTGTWFTNLWSENKKTVTRKETKREPNFDRNEAFTSAEEKIDILLSQEYLLDIYREGKKSGLLTLQPQQGMISSVLGGLIPESLDLQQSISKAYILFESVSTAIAMDKSKKLCRSFCLSWKERKSQTLTAVNSSFTYWTRDTESVLKERYTNLMKRDPLVEAGTLKKIEEIVKQIESQLSLTVQDYNTELSKVYRETLDEVKCSIEDRKPD